MPEENTITITVITEIHQATASRVQSPETPCCQEFLEEYGKEFVLCADGGVAPASVCIQRVKMGKVVYDKPKKGWPRCPLCHTKFVCDQQEVVISGE